MSAPFTFAGFTPGNAEKPAMFAFDLIGPGLPVGWGPPLCTRRMLGERKWGGPVKYFIRKWCLPLERELVKPAGARFASGNRKDAHAHTCTHAHIAHQSHCQTILPFRLFEGFLRRIAGEGACTDHNTDRSVAAALVASFFQPNMPNRSATFQHTHTHGGM